MGPRVSLKALRRYVEEGLGVLEEDNGRVEARVTIHLDPYGETITFIIKGNVSGDYVVLEKYLIDNGREIIERPASDLEAWALYVNESYG